METTATQTKAYADRKLWFSMWFLSAIVTFGLAFFPMFYRLVEDRNSHFNHEAQMEKQVAEQLKRRGKQPPPLSPIQHNRNTAAWAASIILVIPAFVITYLLSKDLAVHEHNQDAFLASAFSERVFMTQTIPIRTYVLITVCTLGVGGIYWLYKVVNLYNAHYKAQAQVEKEIARMMEEQKGAESM